MGIRGESYETWSEIFSGSLLHIGQPIAIQSTVTLRVRLPPLLGSPDASCILSQQGLSGKVQLRIHWILRGQSMTARNWIGYRVMPLLRLREWLISSAISPQTVCGTLFDLWATNRTPERGLRAATKKRTHLVLPVGHTQLLSDFFRVDSGVCHKTKCHCLIPCLRTLTLSFKSFDPLSRTIDGIWVDITADKTPPGC